MAIDFEALMKLWMAPLPDSIDEAAALFRVWYTDPVLVNGVSLQAEDLAARAKNTQLALTEMESQVLDVCDAGDKVAVAFRMSGRHVGDVLTSAGVIPPTGQRISLRIIDILTLTEGRISEVTMVADELAAYAAVQAVGVLGR